MLERPCWLKWIHNFCLSGNSFFSHWHGFPELWEVSYMVRDSHVKIEKILPDIEGEWVTGVFACLILMHYGLSVLGNLSAFLESLVLFRIVEMSTQIPLVLGCCQLCRGRVDCLNFQLVVT